MIVFSTIPFIIFSAYFYFESRKLHKQLDANQNDLDQLKANIKAIASLESP